ncbi:hypothetical protein RCL1_000816 [Eukaryota sp. TZLM3-RCL]
MAINFPVDVVNLNDVIAISSGLQHSLALRSDERVFSWGFNGNGQLGRTFTTDHPRERPGLVPELINVVTISTGVLHNLAVRSDGSAASWGSGGNGELGNGETLLTQQSIQNCGSFASAVNVSAGSGHSLILLEGGDLWVTGGNWNGQLGLGDTTQRNFPVHLEGFVFAAVATGLASNIGVLTNGDVVVWGLNNFSQLGDGTMTVRTTPFVLTHFIDVFSMSISNHVLVAFTSGIVYGWGRNNHGQIGDGTAENLLKNNWFLNVYCGIGLSWFV